MLIERNRKCGEIKNHKALKKQSESRSLQQHDTQPNNLVKD